MHPMNCIRCHRVFQPLTNEKVCINCLEEEEKNFRRIKEYLYEHPGATAAEVANVLNVTMKDIKYYLREGRLEVAGNPNHFLECEKCGSPIKAGYYCEACMKGFEQQGKDSTDGASRKPFSSKEDVEDNRKQGGNSITFRKK